VLYVHKYKHVRMLYVHTYKHARKKQRLAFGRLLANRHAYTKFSSQIRMQ
jgi:hypothetical protein